MRRKKAAKAGEGYYGFGTETAAALELAITEEKDSVPDLTTNQSVLRQILAFVPLVLVAVTNKLFITYIPKWYPNGFDFSALGLKATQ
jgi:hypothetical protein